MTPAEQLAILTAYVETHPPAPSRPLTDAEIAAEDYWAAVGEAMRDEALLPMSRGDEDHRQAAYDEWLTRDAS